MQGVIVCLFDRMVVCVLALAPAFGSRSHILGTAAYRKDIIDMYISRLFLATDGVSQIHVFNAYHDDTQSALCRWTLPLFERLNAFSAANIILPPKFHGQSEWITTIPGLVRRLEHFEWPATVAVRDGGSDVLLSKTITDDDISTYTINTISPANNTSDHELTHPRTEERAILRTALDSVYNRINNTATTLGIPMPSDLTPKLLDMWCEQRVDPFTCATCIHVICDECPAFNEEQLAPLVELTPPSDAAQYELAAVVRLDAGSDRGIGITIDSPDPGVFVIAYGGTEVGDLLLPAIEQALAPPPTALIPAAAAAAAQEHYHLNVIPLQ